ncbi:hypothetical protein QE152_g39763 [Popillia japonica]|uniref:Uncharacterized protein n=1 Tax=Popillia japonica TaxID=7064 RepID=A0AAW1HT90_POPJA
MNMLPSIPPLDMRSDIGNIGERWAKWIQRLENYLVATNIVDENRKTAILLHLIGEDAYDTYMSLPEIPESDPPLTSPFEIADTYMSLPEIPESDPPLTSPFEIAKQLIGEDAYDTYMSLPEIPESDPPLTSPFEIAKQKLKAYFERKVNIDFETFRFRDAKQMSDETIDQYYTRLLKQKSLICSHLDNVKFGSQLQQLLLTYWSIPHATTKKTPYELVFKQEIHNLLPSISTTEDNGNVSKEEEQQRMKHKTYADSKRKTRPHNFQIGDQVLYKIPKANALTPAYETSPYTVIEMKGTQIIAKQENHTITRNASFFKHFVKPDSDRIIPSLKPSVPRGLRM